MRRCSSPEGLRMTNVIDQGVKTKEDAPLGQGVRRMNCEVRDPMTTMAPLLPRLQDMHA